MHVGTQQEEITRAEVPRQKLASHHRKSVLTVPVTEKRSGGERRAVRMRGS